MSSTSRDLAGLVAYLMTNCGGSEFLQVIEERELTFSQLKALTRLYQSEEELLSLKELGELLGLSLPAVSRAVDGLVVRGLVTRTEDTVDRRMKRVAPTREGRELVQQVMTIRAAALQEFVDGLEAEERGALEHALEVLTARPEISSMRPGGSPSA
jgi:DNA-binding MarR family transcriptional regulator